MDDVEGVGGGGGGGGGDVVEQFHHNEAISAVTEDGFGEEDEDYEDLYNDVNVGEGFLQSLKKSEDLGFRNEGESRGGMQGQSKENAGLSIPRVDGGDGERKFDGEVGSGDGFKNQGFSGNDVGVKGQGVGVQLNGGTGSGQGGEVSGAERGYGGGLRVQLGQQNSSNVGDVDEQVGNSIAPQGTSQPYAMSGLNEGMSRQGGGIVNGNTGNVGGMGSSAVQIAPVGAGMGGTGGGGTILFVGDLHWWTTDAELEAELVKYGPVKEVRFFDEKASGKSKGYCQVEFYDPAVAQACKDGMNGHVFNGRPCVVAFASPHTVKRMGEAQVNRNQQTGQPTLPQTRRGSSDSGNKPAGNNFATGGNYQGGDQNRNFSGDQNRNFGRGGWGRGNSQSMGGRGSVGPMRNRPGGMAGRGIMGNGGSGPGGFGQGMGPTPPMMHPQAMMGQGFDPAFGGPMGRMGSYGGFPGAPQPPFQGLMSSFPPVGNVGLPGVAPHVNPAFFGRGMGMGMNGMGMMPNAAVDGPNMGMWSDPSMNGWVGDEHAGRAGESSYGEDAVSDHQYGEASHERSGRPNPTKDKDRAPERDFSGSSDRRFRDEPGYERDMYREKEASHDPDWPSDRRSHRDERDTRDRDSHRDRERSRDRSRERSRDRDRDRDRDSHRERYREDRDKYADHHRYRDREAGYEDEWERRSSRTHGKSRVPQEEERSRSRDGDYGKRRRTADNL